MSNELCISDGCLAQTFGAVATACSVALVLAKIYRMIHVRQLGHNWAWISPFLSLSLSFKSFVRPESNIYRKSFALCLDWTILLEGE
jgi:hypothetical protein